MGRTHDLAGTNAADLPAFRQFSVDAMAVGHWRRLLAMYGDHHEECAVVRERNAGNDSTDVVCECGWDDVFHVSVTALGEFMTHQRALFHGGASHFIRDVMLLLIGLDLLSMFVRAMTTATYAQRMTGIGLWMTVYGVAYLFRRRDPGSAHPETPP